MDPAKPLGPSYACHLLRPANRLQPEAITRDFPETYKRASHSSPTGPIDRVPGLNKRLPTTSEQIAKLLRIWRNVAFGRLPLRRAEAPAIAAGA